MNMFMSFMFCLMVAVRLRHLSFMEWNHTRSRGKLGVTPKASFGYSSGGKKKELWLKVAALSASQRRQVSFRSSMGATSNRIEWIRHCQKIITRSSGQSDRASSALADVDKVTFACPSLLHLCF